ncbi:MAG: SIMPL domain-containing protein [Bacteroidales bacterium]|nr:SIMPL domain-containing protein [Bacteroidales bacterium]MBQ7818158.1 SIMPL domain-containing protein [Bacteroidales bacterium]
MKKLFFAVAFVFATIGFVSAQENEGAYVEINGNAKVKVTPDRAEIEITLRESDLKGKYTLKEWEEKLAMALKTAGVDAKKQLTLYRQSLASAKRKTINQYKTFKLEVYTAEEAQDVMNSLAENNISNSRLTKVWVSDRQSIADSLKVEAIKSAKHDASVLAEAIGQSVGSATRINYYPSRPAVVYRNVMLKASAVETAVMADEAPTLPQINFEEIEIEENVSVRFILNPTKE